jgi:hypothetical protein
MKPIFFMHPPAGARSTRSEERAPEPHEGCPLFDGERKIIAHSHREVGQFNPETPRDVVTEVAHLLEVATQVADHGASRGDRHQSLQGEGPAARQCPRQVLDGVGRRAALPGSTAEVHLHEHRQPASG